MTYDEESWEAYKKVNEIFADYIADAAQEEDLIWVHDYHLMLLPKLLRERMAKKKRQACIGFSLHTPFPPSESLKVLPVAKDILQGMLSSTLVGFHTDDYRNNFTESCEYLLYVSPRCNKYRLMKIETHDPKTAQSYTKTDSSKQAASQSASTQTNSTKLSNRM